MTLLDVLFDKRASLLVPANVTRALQIRALTSSVTKIRTNTNSKVRKTLHNFQCLSLDCWDSLLFPNADKQIRQALTENFTPDFGQCSWEVIRTRNPVALERTYAVINLRGRWRSQVHRPGFYVNCFLGPPGFTVAAHIHFHLTFANSLRQAMFRTGLVVLYFGVGGLAIIKEQDEPRVKDCIEWIYSHHISTQDGCLHTFKFHHYPLNSLSIYSFQNDLVSSSYDCSHVTMVYAALCTLLILGDDLSRVDRHSVLSGVAALQCEDIPGLFRAALISPERDMRFVFSAVASCYMLNGLDYLDREAIVSFIGDSMTYEGGFGNLPGLEAHAGATYCALASLSLLGRLHSFLPRESRVYDRLVKWLVKLQAEGFHGRPQKDDDTCYTFWVCASLKLLNAQDLIDQGALLKFIARCWDQVIGGIRKYPSPGCVADPLHSFLALSGLSCLKAQTVAAVESNHLESSDPDKSTSERSMEPLDQFRWLHVNKLEPILPELNIPEVAHRHLRRIHQSWEASSVTD
ncbi:geranylgeranyl transferase type-1 subunit beta [Clonorchis sinensis]|uniref:Geranylgeranyl transferase type-1 subunit beta n=1 Tax=Clonorchis sinensis TaxID=79923 RepID=G7YXC9_CLOSI|nr:geranylgeranyl transferase type-1 subunit beta [Clonorchis sinensis]